MKRNLPLGFGLLASGCLLLFSITAWNQNANPTKNTSDTMPYKKDRQIKDLDKALEQLNKGIHQLEIEMNKQDWSKIEKEIQFSLKEIEMKKIMAEVDKAMKSVDIEKIKTNVSKALKEIDMEKIKAEVENSLKDIDAAKIKAEIDASLASVNIEKMKIEIEKIKETDFSKIEADLKKIKPEVEKSLLEAKKNLEKAKKEMLEYKTFIDELEKDRLINKKETYTVEHKNGVLKINGQTQPASIYNKYKSFLEKHKDFKMKKEDDGFEIN